MRRGNHEQNLINFTHGPWDAEEPVEFEVWEDPEFFESDEARQQALDEAAARHPSGHKRGNDDTPLPPTISGSLEQE